MLDFVGDEEVEVGKNEMVHFRQKRQNTMEKITRNFNYRCACLEVTWKSVTLRRKDPRHPFFGHLSLMSPSFSSSSSACLSDLLSSLAHPQGRWSADALTHGDQGWGAASETKVHFWFSPWFEVIRRKIQTDSWCPGRWRDHPRSC